MNYGELDIGDDGVIVPDNFEMGFEKEEEVENNFTRSELTGGAKGASSILRDEIAKEMWEGYRRWKVRRGERDPGNGEPK